MLLRIDRTTKDALVHVCDRPIRNPLRGTIRTHSLGTEFVIFDFAQKVRGGCNTVDIPRPHWQDCRGKCVFVYF